MTVESVSVIDVQQLARDWQSQHLLVLTDAERRGRNGLALPFQDATVMELGTAGTLDVEGLFDTVVIDRSSYDPRWLDSITGALTAALHSGGWVIVTLQPGRSASSTTEPAALAGLAWQGLGVLGGQPCALLRAGEPTGAGSAAAGSLLSSAETAVRLAAAPIEEACSWITAARVRRLLVRHIEDRRRSEQSLLLHVQALARELNQERQRYRGTALVRTVLRRSSAGRALLRVLRPWWRLARKLRRVILANFANRPNR